MPNQPLLLLAALLGHGFAWAAVINRVHSQPWRCRTLKRWRDAIVAVNVVAPLLLVWWAYTDAAEPLRTVVFAALSLGLLALLGAIVQHWTRAERAVAESRSTVLDLSDSVAIGDGPIVRLAGVPRNEVRQIDVAEKTLQLPRWPRDAAPLRVLHLTDWHFTGTPDRTFYGRAVEAANELDADLALFSGDLIDRMDLLPWIKPTLGQVKARHGRLFILGNHDWMQQPDAIRTAVADAGWDDVANRTRIVDVDGTRLEIGGSERPWMGTEPSFTSDAVRIGVMHTPDRFAWAVAEGCALAVAGHNHGGQVRLPGVGPLLSPARTGTRYASGVFERRGTVMHVGRGLGALHPLRIRCRPEITLLTLTAVPNDDASPGGLAARAERSPASA